MKAVGVCLNHCTASHPWGHVHMKQTKNNGTKPITVRRNQPATGSLSDTQLKSSVLDTSLHFSLIINKKGIPAASTPGEITCYSSADSLQSAGQTPNTLLKDCTQPPALHLDVSQRQFRGDSSEIIVHTKVCILSVTFNPDCLQCLQSQNRSALPRQEQPNAPLEVSAIQLGQQSWRTFS